MPIRPENRHRYPADWPQIRARIQARAKNCCEQCGVSNHSLGGRLRDGRFLHAEAKEEKRLQLVWPEPGERFWCSDRSIGRRELLRIIRIVCTVAHLDHVPEHCDDENLKFWCQRCHLAYDARHHAESAYHARRAGRALEMFP